MCSELELAYLAGIIDGEGCIDIYKHDAGPRGARKYRFTMRVTVGMGRPELPKWLQQLFGGTLGVSPAKFNGRSAEWRWRVCSLKALYLLNKIYPYLVLKKDQAQIAMSFQKLQSSWQKTYGGAKTPQVVMEQEEELWKALKNTRGKKYHEVQV